MYWIKILSKSWKTPSHLCLIYLRSQRNQGMVAKQDGMKETEEGVFNIKEVQDWLVTKTVSFR